MTLHTGSSDEPYHDITVGQVLSVVGCTVKSETLGRLFAQHKRSGYLLVRLEECLGKAHGIDVARCYIASQVLLLQKVRPYVEVLFLGIVISEQCACLSCSRSFSSQPADPPERGC